jgi:hypothetical protein
MADEYDCIPVNRRLMHVHELIECPCIAGRRRAQ